MIINQTTTLIFEYPQDYLQEQEWCKTKEDRWIHKGTDTLGAVYENQISYSIGATADRKTENSSEIPTSSTISKMEQVEDEPQITMDCSKCERYKDGGELCDFCAIKDEPQTDTEIAKAIVHKMIDDAVIAEDAYPDLRQKMHDAVDEYEPQTERSE